MDSTSSKPSNHNSIKVPKVKTFLLGVEGKCILRILSPSLAISYLVELNVFAHPTLNIPSYFNYICKGSAATGKYGAAKKVVPTAT